MNAGLQKAQAVGDLGVESRGLQSRRRLVTNGRCDMRISLCCRVGVMVISLSYLLYAPV